MLLSKIFIQSIPILATLLYAFPAPVEQKTKPVLPNVNMPYKEINEERVAYDLDRVYEPNPPPSSYVEFTIEYLDKVTGEKKEHEIGMELYGTIVPKTVANFLMFAAGMKIIINKNTRFLAVARYKHTKFDEIIPNQRISGGHVLKDLGSLSIYGGAFKDENFELKHDRPGRLSMRNTGPNTNKAAFFITTGQEPQIEYDDKYVAFGQVTRGLDFILNEFQYLDTDSNNTPLEEVDIKYTLNNIPVNGYLQDEHKLYLEKLEKFRNGDLSQGITLKNMMEKHFPVESSVKKSSSENYFADEEKSNFFSDVGEDFSKNFTYLFFWVLVIASLATSASKYKTIILTGATKSNTIKGY
ncbi:hypothetical protein TPHA_0H02280 [Tetrapisispora phaffii CBS 4417]|uniref:PPIase cyclophilin-type domain-containing protein n=1 Tax=Tetrapisispora phaffii (strain ATCC 24235 / CBS 4417 / NBRC 1672 / NRRL Y-8282 / UCD 70-5) TaxID=1071381 RepID=G8BWI1_TETPH|nr:hypothetical protein TPHA_0H02280 [Tetrapisispora phaffii CBS 4417]CCE64432.1 hypothetical protein TPHA_0H02280 [Tetrapisispora phaffii CBS 4417]